MAFTEQILHYAYVSMLGAYRPSKSLINMLSVRQLEDQSNRSSNEDLTQIFVDKNASNLFFAYTTVSKKNGLESEKSFLSEDVGNCTLQ